jgi:hypothetical protein
MDMDFANACPLVRPALPHIRFLFVGSRLCSTLPSDSPSQFCPCALLVLHLHQVAQGTFTPKLSDMSDTQTAARRLRRWPVASLDCGCARRHPEPRSGRRNGPRGRTKKLRPLPDLFAEFSRRDFPQQHRLGVFTIEVSGWGFQLGCRPRRARRNARAWSFCLSQAVPRLASRSLLGAFFVGYPRSVSCRRQPQGAKSAGEARFVLVWGEAS